MKKNKDDLPVVFIHIPKQPQIPICNYKHKRNLTILAVIVTVLGTMLPVPTLLILHMTDQVTKQKHKQKPEANIRNSNDLPVTPRNRCLLVPIHTRKSKHQTYKENI